MSSLSARRKLLDAFADCLQQITVANGYRTDLGLSWTSEPGQVDGSRADAALTAVIAKQVRPTDENLVRRRRLTTVAVIAKLPTAQEQEQAALDRICSDIEQAMDGQFARFPVGIPYPKYQSMEPIKPPAGAGWTGAVFTYTSEIPIT